VVPAGIDATPNTLTPGKGFVGSGGYTISASDASTTTLSANDHYCAGRPAIGTIELHHDICGRRGVRRDLARLRPDPGAAAPPDGWAVARLLRVRHEPAAVFRRPRPPGVRAGGGLAATGRPLRRGEQHAGDRDGAARHPGP